MRSTGEDVEGAFNDADLGLVAAGVGADGAGVCVGEVLTLRAEEDALFDADDGLSQGLGSVGHAYEVVGEPLGAFGADAGQLVKLVDKTGDGGGCGGEVFHGYIVLGQAWDVDAAGEGGEAFGGHVVGFG